MQPGALVIPLTILLALLLAAARGPLEWPEWIAWFRPAWVYLTVLFWAMAVPHRMGVIGAWLWGLMLDVLRTEPLGLNAALLAILALVVGRLSDRIRMYPLTQQCLVVLAVIATVVAVRQTVGLIIAEPPISPLFLLPAVVSAALWPWLRALLERLRVLAGL